MNSRHPDPNQVGRTVPGKPSVVAPVFNRQVCRLSVCSGAPLLLLIGAWSFFGSSLCTLRSPVQESYAFLAEVAAPTASALGSWLISAAAVLSLFALGKQLMRKTPLEAEFLTKKEFNDFRDKVDTNFNSLRDRIDNSHDALAHKLDNINTRLSDVNALVARLDERTKSPASSNERPAS